MTNQTFFNATFIARKARVLRNGEVPIILRITIAGQRAELNINRTVNPDMWVAAKVCPKVEAEPISNLTVTSKLYGQSYSQSIHKWLRKVRSLIPTR